ncbi:MAG: hypothetical protein EPN75_07765 [Beijerinckiaceae bacterium]|nr:MAG: hypothetical protein EPN75_07765 [Beijerinckiaceae bacterium]
MRVAQRIFCIEREALALRTMWPKAIRKSRRVFHSSAAADCLSILARSKTACPADHAPATEAVPVLTEPESRIPFCYSTILLRTLGVGSLEKTF